MGDLDISEEYYRQRLGLCVYRSRNEPRGEAWNTPFCKSFRGIRTLLTSGFQTSDLQNFKTIHFHCLSHPDCVPITTALGS